MSKWNGIELENGKICTCDTFHYHFVENHEVWICEILTLLQLQVSRVISLANILHVLGIIWHWVIIPLGFTPIIFTKAKDHTMRTMRITLKHNGKKPNISNANFNALGPLLWRVSHSRDGSLRLINSMSLTWN